MIITDKDRQLAVMSREINKAVKGGQPAKKPTFYQRCRAAGRDPQRIRNFIEQEGMTLEQALKVPPMERSQVGRAGKRRSSWGGQGGKQ